MKDITQEVIDGFDFIFDVVEQSHDTQYASKEEKSALKAAGEWFADLKRSWNQGNV